MKVGTRTRVHYLPVEWRGGIYWAEGTVMHAKCSAMRYLALALAMGHRK